MAYKIQYSPETWKHYPGVKTRNRTYRGYLLVVMLAIVAVCLLRAYGIPDFLIPGDSEVTRKAASLMMNELRGGSSLNDAVTVFCKEILHGAGF